MVSDLCMGHGSHRRPSPLSDRLTLQVTIGCRELTERRQHRAGIVMLCGRKMLEINPEESVLVQAAIYFPLVALSLAIESCDHWVYHSGDKIYSSLTSDVLPTPGGG